MTDQTMKFLSNYYRQLLDFTVIDVEFEHDDFDDEDFPVLIMRNASGTKVRVTISSDEEGNSAGFLFMEEVE